VSDQPSGRDVARVPVSRRGLAGVAGGVALVGGLAVVTAGGMLGTRVARESQSEPVSLSVDPANVQALSTLSATLCGGGAFDSDRTETLLELLAADPDLSRGFVDLVVDDPVPGTEPVLSAEAEATMQAILRYWYIGEFAGEPVADRAAIYDQLTAWQAMYTPPYAVCKAYGAWAEAPEDQPALPSF
jgi:hypothetical protein